MKKLISTLLSLALAHVSLANSVPKFKAGDAVKIVDDESNQIFYANCLLIVTGFIDLSGFGERPNYEIHTICTKDVYKTETDIVINEKYLKLAE